VLKRLARRKRTCLRLVADYLYVMARGKIVHENSPSELNVNKAVKNEFLAV